MHNETLRELLSLHFKDWRVIDEAERMTVHGWVRATGVEITITGLRGSVVETLQALISTLVNTERLPTHHV